MIKAGANERKMFKMSNDFNQNGIIRIFPKRLQVFYLLARFDRPAGWQLLYLPCCFGLLLAQAENITKNQIIDWKKFIIWLGLFAIGAITMRAAGCVWNDIVDRKLDRLVERTKMRPLAANLLPVSQALIFCSVLLVCSFGVFGLLPIPAKIMAIAILPLVMLYPLMKRVTSIPQLMLGIVFNWGVFVGYSTFSGAYPGFDVILLWGGGIFWTLGYDTIYACQDRDYDRQAGIKSLALLLGKDIKIWVAVFYIGFAGLYLMAFTLALGLGSFWDFGKIALWVSLLNVLWLIKIQKIDLTNVQVCLKFFQQNCFFGFLYFAGSVCSLIV